MAAAHRSGFEAIILSSPYITVKGSPPLHPAIFLLHTEFEFEQDCDLVIKTSTSPRPDLMQTPKCFDEFEKSLCNF